MEAASSGLSAMELLIKAAEDGDISDLYRLIPENPRILKQLDDLPFAQTPLHVAASKGHGRFFLELMRLMPSLASKLNHAGFSPLHVALMMEPNPGLTRMVLRIVRADPKLIRVKSREGVTLLHYVAELSNLTLLSEFLAICPESINDMTIRSETALHIAVKHRNFDATEVLMGWLERGFYQDVINLKQKVVNWQDDEGNTVLHIAAQMDDLQLFQLLRAGGVANMDLQNFELRTALDILKQRRHREDKMLQEILKTASNAATYTLPPFEIYLRTKIILFERMVIHLFGGVNHKDSQIRGGLLVVAVLVATATYSAGINPPGGVWSSTIDSHLAGTVVMDGALFYVFQAFNATAFCASMTLIFLMLPSGIFMMLLQYSLVACYMLSMVIISPTYLGRCAFSGVLIVISLGLGLYYFSYLRFKEIFRLCREMLGASSTENWQSQSEAARYVGTKRFILSFAFVISDSLLATSGYFYLVLTDYGPF